MASLSFADDILLLANSAADLQTLFDRLAQYSAQWGLVVNTKKTVVMIFNKAGRLLADRFKYNDTNLDTVNETVYLGIVFVPSGIFSITQTNLAQRASRTMYKIQDTRFVIDVKYV